MSRFFSLLNIIICMSFCSGVEAQWYDPEKVNKKTKAINEKAYAAAMDGNYAKSLELLNDAIISDNRFVEGYLSRAGIYAEKKNYAASVKDFEDALQLDPVFSKTYLLPYSISLAGIGEFDRALKAVLEFLQNPTLNEYSIRSGNYRKQCYEFALQYAKDHSFKDYTFSTHNLSPNINSSDLEYFPSVTIDGKKIIFTKRIGNDEDFYESALINGEWTKATPLEGRINTNLNEGAQNVSQDGQVLIFTGCNYPEGEGSCDLYISYKTKTGSWTEPENMGPIVNTDFWESSPSLSPDKKELYFSSGRPGGYGGKDIWVTRKNLNGKWGRPENLGEDINTPGDEGCPFMHADNQTLYFNSNGHPGYGTTDLFLSRKTDQGWEVPTNLGYPINTIDDEGSLVVASDGTTSYYASERSDSKGGLDLYTFQLPKELSAQKTLWVNGKVFDKKTGNGLPSTVELSVPGKNKIISKLQTDEDGNYLVTLPIGKDYAFNVNRKGYLFFSDNFSLTGTSADSARTIDIPLQPLEAGSEIVLRNIFFNSKEFKLKTESYEELNRVVQLMKENPKLRILISGHTDNVGNPADNLVLSKNRAKAVVNYLSSQGIEMSRLTAKGFGETKPMGSNDNETGKSRNRRTELNILSIQ